MRSMRQRTLYPLGTPNSYCLDLDDLLEDNKFSFLIDRSIKKEFYYNDYLSESEVKRAINEYTIHNETKRVPINEMTAKEIVAGADSARLLRSRDKRINCYFEQVTPARGWIRFRVSSQYTPRKFYKVHIKLKEADSIKYFKEFRKQDIIRLLLSGDLQVHCSCPDFRFRHKYQAWQMGYGLYKEMRFPRIANPKLTGSVCKHVLAVLKILQFNNQAITSKMVKSKFFKRKMEEEEYQNTLQKRMRNKNLKNRGRRNSR